ncbi:DMT family transporter [Paraburkholderia sp. CNPSo 3281]|uniref:DMT family transporter n=1 Tax=Paraburkholderia sp. CNPSo 3281 TaxID=2940933 RepID=UPI0020B6AF6C|nr:DMT family transporter [Paraburkholderia sp. CNPSo 3281]MCP3721188.1 DMT family transporter [Paraburkholderia sp. CNPSo 3281]
MSAKASATLAAATTGILVGAAMVSTRAVSDEASPATLAFLRYFIGMGVLAAPVWLGARPRFAWRDAFAISLLGIFQFAVLIVLLNHALAILPAATCALVFSTMPLFTMTLAVASRSEAFSLHKLFGLLIALAGVAVLLRASFAHPGSVDMGALSALIGATLIGAVCSLLYRLLLKRYPALPTSALAMSAAVVFLVGLCWITARPLMPTLSMTQWENVGFIGLSSGVGYFCWLWALTRLDASRVVAFQALGPVTAAVVEVVVTRQWPTSTLVIAVALVVSGLLVSQWRKPEREIEHSVADA